VLGLPPLPEQLAIAAFLDGRTSRVDRLIEKKRVLIERLGEKRTALISRTVTRGLPPAAARAAGLLEHPPLKPSGLDWLGDIPDRWEVRKFSREVAIAEGQVDPEKEPFLSMLLIGPEHVESGTGRLLQRATAADQTAESGKYLCGKGCVVYSKIRPALRKLVIAPEDCLCSADMYPLQGRGRIENRYIYWLFLSQQFSAWSVLEADRVAMPKINRDTLNELRMPVPPLSEQLAIAAYLDAETAKLDSLVARVQTAIERLQEYRTALITAAVTGKIDVRKETA
jgi:type I restriction enzyme S subunit